MGKVIGVVSLKGGVGKTSSVVALGEAISQFNKKVLLIDANFSAPNLGLHLNIVEPDITLHHVLNGKAHIKDAIYAFGNIDVIPCSIFNRSIINPLLLKNKINSLKKRYDVILIDSAPSLNEETLSVILASDELLLVTTPDHLSISTILKASKLAKQRGALINGLILNKVHKKDFELSLDEIEKTTEIPVMAVIPHDLNILKSLSKFTPCVGFKPKAESSIEYKKLAAVLIGEKYKPFNLRNFVRITPKRQEINREVFYEGLFK
ncbi:MAG: AAA family ATPase [Nanoarchaeota archaeon]|nr:AAA family ATPase [Nanoarchaeota archaeon]MBU4116371.1 AAA family ATPase [Nanoarchaeota archaeon]